MAARRRGLIDKAAQWLADPEHDSPVGEPWDRLGALVLVAMTAFFVVVVVVGLILDW